MVAACLDDSGAPVFLDEVPPATRDIPGIGSSAYFWRVVGSHSVPSSVGGPATSPGPATESGSALAIVRIAAGANTKKDLSEYIGPQTGDAHGDAQMHATTSIDYEIILSGRIDFVLPGGQRRTLETGDILVVTGAPHAWDNPYDEDCVYLSITIAAPTLTTPDA
jgi:mannose-6-phosphate isomerase-like protein (cupin superfamily)